jgi:hypothetical protein
MNRLWIILCSVIGFVYTAGICSPDTLDTNSTEIKPAQTKTNNVKANDVIAEFGNSKISGDIALFEGQIVKGYGTAQVGPFEHAWIQQASGLLRLDTKFNEHTRMIIEGQADVQFSYTIPQSLWDKEFVENQKVANFSFWLKQAKGTYNFGGLDAKTFPLQIDLGEFEYKYNPDVRNLGEYLFRASAYPVYFLNWFDGAFYRMAGLKVTTHPVDWFNFDALLFSELYQVPLQDFSLAGVATISNPEIHLGNYTIGKVISVCAGIDFNRLFSVDERYTTTTSGARADDNMYSRDSIGVDSNGMTMYKDSLYYTFRSTKVALTASIDFKGFFRCPIFGSEDLKLYGEMAILGLKDYVPKNPIRPDTFYANMSQRMPIMVGFNFPAFKILDVLCLELEYYHSPFLPSSRVAFKEGIPVPDNTTGSIVSIQDTKWSVYLKKRIGAFMVVAQAARDHYQPLNNNVGYTERGDVMAEGKDWWWMVKLQYGY